MELLLGTTREDDSTLEDDICCVLSRLPLQENEADILHGSGGIHALTARLSTAPRNSTRRHALVTLAHLALFPASRTAILIVLPAMLSFSAKHD